MDTFPLISQLKSLIQLLFGQTSRAFDTQINFIDAAPILSQFKSLIELLTNKDSQKAKNTQIKFLSHLNALVDGIPIIGHCKSLLSYIINVKIRNDTNNKWYVLAFKRSTRTTLVIFGGYFAATIALPLGATLNATAISSSIGSILGGFTFDYAMLHNAMSCSGHYAHELTYFHPELEHKQQIDKFPENEDSDIGLKFDKLMGVILDGLIGAHIGYSYYCTQSIGINTSAAADTLTINTLPPPPQIPIIPSSIVSKYPILSGIQHIPLPPPVNPLTNPSGGLQYGVTAAYVQRWANQHE